MSPKTPDPERLELLQGTLDMLILRTLQWGPRHGHGIGQNISQQSDELLKVETGSLYPALHRLEKKGWLKSEWGISEANHKAKFYRLTATGKAQLSREQDRWSQLVHAIGRVMKPAEQGIGIFAINEIAMQMILPVHILAGGLALLSGYVALYAAKGAATSTARAARCSSTRWSTMSLSGAFIAPFTTMPFRSWRV